MIINAEKLLETLKRMNSVMRSEYIVEQLEKVQNKTCEEPWIEKVGDDKGVRKKMSPSPRRAAPSAYSDEFLAFWKEYPRKTGKGAAWKSFWNASCQELTQRTFLTKCLEALAWQKKSKEHLQRDEQYIPHAQTWLNQRRWEDEPASTSEDQGFDQFGVPYGH